MCAQCSRLCSRLISWCSFIAKVISDTQFGHYGQQVWPLVDPAKMVLFDDGAEVPFYIKRHGRARRDPAFKHAYLSNETVRFLVVLPGSGKSIVK